VEEVQNNMWILGKDGKSIVSKDISMIPGLFKLFDEGIVNCRDHVVRMQQLIEKGENVVPVTHIDITICKETGRITMTNDGNGIDVARHPENNLWIPEITTRMRKRLWEVRMVLDSSWF
jgi:DNA topoisomerase-2